MIPLVIPTIACALACAVLVVGEHRKSKLQRAIAKPIASLAFVATAALAMTAGEPAVPSFGDYQLAIVIGLVLGVAGDIALLGKSSRAFLAGLGAFLLGHIAYVVAFAQLAPHETWLHPLAAIPAGLGLVVLRLLWPRLGNMRVPVIIYVIAIVTMMAAAIGVARTEAVPETNRWLAFAGAALFFVSDLAVARDRFVAATFANRAWGLPAYYAGQLLLAWSLWIRS